MCKFLYSLLVMVLGMGTEQRGLEAGKGGGDEHVRCRWIRSCQQQSEKETARNTGLGVVLI